MTTTNDVRSLREDDYSTSRRTFLAAAGATAGAGLVTGSAVEGDGRGGAVAIDASPSQRGAAGDALDGLRARHPAADVSLSTAETTGALRRFTEGEVDVVAASRPMLPDERARAGENGVAFDGREIPTDRAALLAPGTWCECLRPNRLADAWGGDGAVETWAEVTSTGAAAGGAVTSHGPSEESERRDHRTDPVPDGTVLVRGAREFQYAAGSGGVGYYEFDGDDVASTAAAAENDADSPTSLVRLAFLYVDRDSLSKRPVEEFLRAYSRRSARRVGGVSYFANPIDGV